MSNLILTPSFFAIIDEAGALHSEIARLEKQLSALKSQIKSQGLGKNQGFIYESNVYEKTIAAKTDWQAVAMKLEPSYQLIAAHTGKESKQVAINFERV